MSEKFTNALDDLIQESRREGDTRWEGTMKDYLALAHDNARIAQTAPGRIYDMVMQKGAVELPEHVKLPHYEDLVRYYSESRTITR